MTTHRYDFDRRDRIGMPEAILCEGKETAHLARLVAELAVRTDHPVLLTRLSSRQYDAIATETAASLHYEPHSRTAFLNGTLPARAGNVAVVTAGTSDLPAALEAQRTLTFMGVSTTLVADVGVAGLWRLTDRIEEIRRHDVIICVAGMDAALLSVMGGLVAQPVIGVPTSVGYGVAAGGQAALHSMLASCAQGVLVTNIDNGFGAACAAARLLTVKVAR
jgi:NCAIR mutase (PurE)-related protein